MHSMGLKIEYNTRRWACRQLLAASMCSVCLTVSGLSWLCGFCQLSLQVFYKLAFSYTWFHLTLLFPFYCIWLKIRAVIFSGQDSP
jgi:hypothetical protein